MAARDGATSEEMTFAQLVDRALAKLRAKNAKNAQIVLAGKMGVSQGAVSRYAAGEIPRRSLWPVIATALGVTLEELVAAIARSPKVERGKRVTQSQLDAAEREIEELKAELAREKARRQNGTRRKA